MISFDGKINPLSEGADPAKLDFFSRPQRTQRVIYLSVLCASAVIFY
jgi:hypothetical protein